MKCCFISSLSTANYLDVTCIGTAHHEKFSCITKYSATFASNFDLTKLMTIANHNCYDVVTIQKSAEFYSFLFYARTICILLTHTVVVKFLEN